MIKLVVAALMSYQSKATICLRAPQVSQKEFQEWIKSNSQCENSQEILFRQMRTDPDHDLEILGNRLRTADGVRKKQIAIFKDFFEYKKKQAWSKRTVDVVVEVLKRWNIEAGNPAEITKMIDQLEHSEDQLDGIARPADWADAIIYRNAIRSSSISGLGSRHWVIYSSLYRPVILWGTAEQAIAKISAEKRPWLTGTCEKPSLNFNTAPQEDYLFLYPGGCVAHRPALVNPINKNQPTIVTMTQPKKFFYETPLFWGVTTLSALLISSALRNKTVTIRSAIK